MILRKAILTHVLLFLCMPMVFGQTVVYTASTEAMANPERGLQKYSITSANYATVQGTNNLSVSTLTNWRNGVNKVTVVYRFFLLDAFMNSDINATFLDNMQGDFDNIRTAGAKAIVRFAYSDGEGTTPQQPSKAQILTHINQLSPLLNSNKDVIFTLQAGFIGTWGEWYYTNSSEFGTEDNISSTQWDNRKDILDAMLDATPMEIPIQVRYVGIKTQMYGTTQLTEQTAYQNTANARVGFYNDAFLNNWGDQGTYSVGSGCADPVGTSDYVFLSNETQYLPMTGETNGLNNCNGGLRTTPANAIYEMGLTHWTTLNRDYHPNFWNQFATAEYDEVLKRLGYRFVLDSSVVSATDDEFDLTLHITNEGFARVFKQRNVYLVLKNVSDNSTTTHLINSDIRTWEGEVTVTQHFSLGLTGTFELYLWAPDMNPTLETDPNYCIQLANENMWQSATGFNDLFQTVTLTTPLGITDLPADIHFSIYPNPTTDRITIQLHNSENEVIQLLNSKGQTVREIGISQTSEMDVSGLESGVYFIRLLNDEASAQRFVIN